MESYRASSPLAPLPARLVVLLSGRGSNFEALADGCASGEIPGAILGVISDRPAAPGLEKARLRGIEAVEVVREKREKREDHEFRLMAAVDRMEPDLICLAGFMRVLSPAFVTRYPLRILNVHPSLLPAFPGLNAQRQALDYGCRVAGATVHFVDSGVDSGPIVGQKAIEIEEGDTEEGLSRRILAIEHGLYRESVRRVLLGGWSLTGRSISFESGGSR